MREGYVSMDEMGKTVHVRVAAVKFAALCLAVAQHFTAPIVSQLRAQLMCIVPRLILITTATVLVAFGSQEASAQEHLGEQLPVKEVTLANGMRFLILPRDGSPTVSFVARFGVGSVHERSGTTGTAHLLEHLLFKGTTTIGTRDVNSERDLFGIMDAIHDTLIRARAGAETERVEILSNRIKALEDSARIFTEPNEFDRILTEAGARGLNATTSSEATTYFVELPANRTELWFALEAERMSDPVFRDFYTERNVVMEERRLRVETNPVGLLYEAHLNAAFSVHPYGIPVIGYMSDLETLSRRDVKDYYNRFYGPNNTVVSIVGDINPDQVEGWARSYFSSVPRGEDPPPILVEEPQQVGERRVIVEWDTEPRLRIGWHVPSSLHRDAETIAILSSILCGGRTSRLHRRMVLEDRIATAVFATTGPGARHPQLLTLEATPIGPHTTAELENIIYEEIDRLAADGPTDDELERVRNQVEAGAIRRIDSNLGVAFQLADSESLTGDWRHTFRSAARLQRVSAEDVRRVAADYLTEQNRTVAVLKRETGL